MQTVNFTGTVSRATMRPQDLIPKFMDVLQEYHPEVYQRIKWDIAQEYDLALCEIPEDSEIWRSEFMAYILNEDIWQALNEIAPDYFYFGANEGDGSDYGFWICWDSLIEDIIAGEMEAIEAAIEHNLWDYVIEEIARHVNFREKYGK